jgi:hypothetical protein
LLHNRIRWTLLRINEDNMAKKVFKIKLKGKWPEEDRDQDRNRIGKMKGRT